MKNRQKVLEFRRKGKRLDLSPKEKICFACGAKGRTSITLDLSRDSNRDTIVVPGCEDCGSEKKNLDRMLKIRTVLAIGISIVTLGLLVPGLIIFSQHWPWSLLLAVCLTFGPWNAVWSTRKELDRVCAMVTFLEVTGEHVRIEFRSEVAFSRVARHQDAAQ